MSENLQNKEGRPTVFDETTLQKLEIAFSNDATDEQACFIANISPSSLYNYQKKNPEFLERKKALKSMVSYQAKANIRNAVFGDDIKEKLETSKWLLPKKEKKEYSDRIEHTGEDGQPISVNIINYKE